MSLMNKLPILLVKDKDIKSGIFDAKLSEAFVVTITFDYNSKKRECNQTLKNWLTTL